MIEELEIAIRTYSDKLPSLQLDSLFLFSQTPDNENSVIERAKQLIENNTVKNIAIIYSGAMSGYSGFDSMLSKFKNSGIAPEQVVGVPSSNTTMLHTLIESESMIRFSLQQDYARIGVCASPFHQYRAFMTSISVAIQEYPDLDIYSCPGKPMSWNKNVLHSQGKERGTRLELLHAEFARISKYQAKGDLQPSQAILNYLNRRDTKNNLSE